VETHGRFLVEIELSEAGWLDVQRLSAEIRAAADELARAGTVVRVLRTISVPEEESCFLLFDGESADAVLATCARVPLSVAGISHVQVPA
jgi:muconolactone delta-isomerase